MQLDICSTQQHFTSSSCGELENGSTTNTKVVSVHTATNYNDNSKERKFLLGVEKWVQFEHSRCSLYLARPGILHYLTEILYNQEKSNF